MLKEIVFATNNKNKLRELREIVGDKFRILSLDEIGCNDEIEENGATFAENALIKARYVKEHYGYDCFADDSGLEVDALGGAPGVYSARYAGEPSDSEKNIDKLLSELAGKTERSARFRTVFALILGEEIHYFDGAVEGEIIEQRSGSDGFGYDPIFLPEGSKLTFAEM
ncbi:MAG: RdgB/HAM1 family non-canonical purine NTP pyrophosphatase, partial [Muribaculaceae bacterium]|nr:RdgB/HAM1 family non-canonical purine NTP pyrophosphatase [Muribaculaceae bacterium]